MDKMYYKRFLTLSFLFFLLSLVIISCSSSNLVSEREIRNDLIKILSSKEEITDIEIEKRDTDKNNKIDRIWCIVRSQDNVIEYTRHFLIEAYLYSDGGWRIEDIAETDLSLWIKEPISGVDESNIMGSIIGKTFIIENEEWIVNQDTIEKIEILNQDTNLEEETDKVVINLQLNSDVMKSEGDIELNYEFMDGWNLSKINESDSFKAIYKEGYQLSYSEEDILDAIVQKTMKLGEGRTEQYISLGADEISEISVYQDSMAEKGTIRIIDFMFNLDKASVLFSVDGKLVYQFQNQRWSIASIDLTPDVLDLYLVGQWIGQYTASQGDTKMVLEITNVADDGSISAIFSFSALPTNPGVPSGSAKFIGGINLNDLSIYLEGVEWIERPKNYNFVDFEGLLYVDDNYIKSIRGLNFEISR